MSTTILNSRTLLPDGTFDSVRKAILDGNPDMSEDMAERIAAEGVKFVVACAKNPRLALAPSRIVDEGWHALLLHSAAYTALCSQFGGMVHHYPGWDPTHYDPPILDRTRQMIERAGFEVDEQLWRPPTDDLLVSVAAKCQHAPECTIRPMPTPQPPVASAQEVAHARVDRPPVRGNGRSVEARAAAGLA